jgi:hypothetical protein
MIGRQVSSMLFPEWKRDPGFDVVNNLIDASSEVYLRSSLSPIPDAVKPRLLTTPFSTTAFARSTVWRFEASSCKAASKDLPSSHVQHGASAPSWHNVSLGIGATGSHVPYKSLIWLRAAYMPDAARADFRITPELIPGTSTSSQ